MHQSEQPASALEASDGMLSLTLNGASLTWRDLAAALTAERLGITMDLVARNQM